LDLKAEINAIVLAKSSKGVEAAVEVLKGKITGAEGINQISE